jgi:hypothetical protein
MNLATDLIVVIFVMPIVIGVVAILLARWVVRSAP